MKKTSWFIGEVTSLAAKANLHSVADQHSMTIYTILWYLWNIESILRSDMNEIYFSSVAVNRTHGPVQRCIQSITRHLGLKYSNIKGHKQHGYVLPPPPSPSPPQTHSWRASCRRAASSATTQLPRQWLSKGYKCASSDCQRLRQTPRLPSRDRESGESSSWLVSSDYPVLCLCPCDSERAVSLLREPWPSTSHVRTPHSRSITPRFH